MAVVKKYRVNFLRGTEADYQALTTKDKDTLYFIVGEEDVNKIYMGEELIASLDFNSLQNRPYIITEQEVQNILNKIEEKQNILTEQDKKDIANLAGELGYITSKEVEDNYLKINSIADWAKQPVKPSYTAKEVGALPDTTEIPSIEGLISEAAADKKYQEKGNYLTEEQDPTVPNHVKNIKQTDIDKWNEGKSYSAGEGINISVDNEISVDTDKVLMDTDISAWAKETTKPSYTPEEIGALAVGDISDWAKQSTKPEYTADEVGAISKSIQNTLATKEDLANLKHFKVVAELPLTPDPTLIYLVPKTGTVTVENVYDEYIWIVVDETSHWEFLGSTEVDVSNKITTPEVAGSEGDFLSLDNNSNTIWTKDVTNATLQYSDTEDAITVKNMAEIVMENTSTIGELQDTVSSNKADADTKINTLTTIVGDNKTELDNSINNVDNRLTETITYIQEIQTETNNYISQEIENRKSADTELKNNFESADIELQNQINNLLPDNQAVIYKGKVNTEQDLPINNVDIGWAYKVTADGTYKEVECKNGDFLVLVNKAEASIEKETSVIIDGPTNGDYLKLYVSAPWNEKLNSYVIDENNQITFTIYQKGQVRNTDSSIGDYYYGPTTSTETSGNRIVLMEPQITQIIDNDNTSTAGFTTETNFSNTDSDRNLENGYQIFCTDGGNNNPKKKFTITVTFNDLDYIKYPFSLQLYRVCFQIYVSGIRKYWNNQKVVENPILLSGNFLQQPTNEWSKLLGHDLDSELTKKQDTFTVGTDLKLENGVLSNTFTEGSAWKFVAGSYDDVFDVGHDNKLLYWHPDLKFSTLELGDNLTFDTNTHTLSAVSYDDTEIKALVNTKQDKLTDEQIAKLNSNLATETYVDNAIAAAITSVLKGAS